jgi:hypothetical protein
MPRRYVNFTHFAVTTSTFLAVQQFFASLFLVCVQQVFGCIHGRGSYRFLRILDAYSHVSIAADIFHFQLVLHGVHDPVSQQPQVQVRHRAIVFLVVYGTEVEVGFQHAEGGLDLVTGIFAWRVQYVDLPCRIVSPRFSYPCSLKVHQCDSLTSSAGKVHQHSELLPHCSSQGVQTRGCRGC